MRKKQLSAQQAIRNMGPVWGTLVCAVMLAGVVFALSALVGAICWALSSVLGAGVAFVILATPTALAGGYLFWEGLR